MEHGNLAPPQERSHCFSQVTGASRRPWLIGAAVLMLAIALYAGWDWLAALGVTTVLIAFAPCLAMCALALCTRPKKASGDK